MLVSVCICTYARPAVVETILSVLAQEGVSSSDFEIIVCDEDEPGTSAREAVEQIAAHTKTPIRYLAKNARNLAVSRNACIEAARGEWIAFIDDDEIAEKNWLAELLAAQAEHNADVVKGFVKGVYPAAAPGWVRQCDPFTRDFGPTGTRQRFVATNGVLFCRALAVVNRIEFDAKFGSGGGEDPDFFLKLGDRGAVMISCRSSVVYEHVPLSRLNMGYFRRRYWADGYVYGVVYLSRLPRMYRMAMAAKSSAIAGLCVLYLPIMYFDVSLGFKMFKKLWAHLGILYWISGGKRASNAAVS